MTPFQTDFLVVGAGASGMSFVDTLLGQCDADVIMVDRRHRPGGHWNDAYPFVRLHQPASYYGVESRELLADHMDLYADRAGLATGTELCEYYQRVLEDRLMPSGRVRFFGSTTVELAADGSPVLRSRLDGRAAPVIVRQRLVDATYPQASIPLHHTPDFSVAPEARVIPPNSLVSLDRPARGFTILGGGKTAMDTCYWLLEQGVPANSIRWIRARDHWVLDRERFIPRPDTSSPLDFQTRTARAGAAATGNRDLARRLEAQAVLHRLDSGIEPDVFRGAALSRAEADELRRIENVVRLGRVVEVGSHEIRLTGGAVPTHPDEVHVDCTASGTEPPEPTPIFGPDRIDIKQTTFGVQPWSAAIIAFLAVHRDDDSANRLCPVFRFPGPVDDPAFVEAFRLNLQTSIERSGEPDLAEWGDSLRLNPARGLSARMGEPLIQETLGELLAVLDPALQNLARLGSA